MAVYAAVRRKGEERLAEELPEGNYGYYVRRPFAYLRHRFRRVDVFRRYYSPYAVDDGKCLAGARRKRLASPGRTVGLRYDADDFQVRLAHYRAEADGRSGA